MPRMHNQARVDSQIRVEATAVTQEITVDAATEGCRGSRCTNAVVCLSMHVRVELENAANMEPSATVGGVGRDAVDTGLAARGALDAGGICGSGPDHNVR